jgi:hypothetical protein
MCIPLNTGGGTPSSSQCLQSFLDKWVVWAGLPRSVVVDRGLHNRGVFSRYLASHGITIRQAGLESAEQIGRTERHGGLFKDLLKKVVTDKNVAGAEEIAATIAEVVKTKNNLYRRGGFAPQQWVTGRLQRVPGSTLDEEEFADLGSLAVTASDGTAEFGRQASIRESARKHFAKIDCGSKVARALLRKSAPIPGEYQVGDLISYRRKPRIGEQGTQWSTACRVIGREGSKTLWVLQEGVPVCVATDKVRPCTGAEALAYQYMSRDVDNVRTHEPPEGTQQGFVDLRRDDDGPPDHGSLTPIAEISDDELADDSDEHRVTIGNDVRAFEQPEEEEHLMIASDPEARRREILDDVPRQVRRRLNESVRSVTLDEQGSSSLPREPQSENSLLDVWRRTGENQGADMLERRTTFVAFMQERTHKKKSDVMGRNLNILVTKLQRKESLQPELKNGINGNSSTPL